MSVFNTSSFLLVLLAAVLMTLVTSSSFSIVAQEKGGEADKNNINNNDTTVINASTNATSSPPTSEPTPPPTPAPTSAPTPPSTPAPTTAKTKEEATTVAPASSYAEVQCPSSSDGSGGSSSGVDGGTNTNNKDGDWCFKVPESGIITSSPIFHSSNNNLVAFATRNQIIGVDLKTGKRYLNASSLYGSNSEFASSSSPFGSFTFGKGKKHPNTIIAASTSGVILVKMDQSIEVRIQFASATAFIATNNDNYFFTVEVGTGMLYAISIDEAMSNSSDSPISVEKIQNKASFNLTKLGEGQTIEQLDFKRASIVVSSDDENSNNNNSYVVVAFGNFIQAFKVNTNSADGEGKPVLQNLTVPSKNWGGAFLLNKPVTEQTLPFVLPRVSNKNINNNNNNNKQIVFAGLDSSLYSRDLLTKEPIWSYSHDNRMSFRANPSGAFSAQDGIFVVTTCHSEILAFKTTDAAPTTSGNDKRLLWKSSEMEKYSHVDSKLTKFSSKIAPVILNGKVFAARQDGNIEVLNLFVDNSSSSVSPSSVRIIKTGATAEGPLTSISVSAETNRLIYIIADQLVKSTVIPVPPMPTTAAESSNTTTMMTPPTDPPPTPAPPTPTPPTPAPPTPSPPDTDEPETPEITKRRKTKKPTTTENSPADDTEAPSTTTSTSTVAPRETERKDTTAVASRTTPYQSFIIVVFLLIVIAFLYQNREHVPGWIERAKKFIEEQQQQQQQANHQQGSNHNNNDGGDDDDDEDVAMNQVHEGVQEDNEINNNSTSAVVSIPPKNKKTYHHHGDDFDDQQNDDDDRKHLVNTTTSELKKPSSSLGIQPIRSIGRKKKDDDDDDASRSHHHHGPKKGFSSSPSGISHHQKKPQQPSTTTTTVSPPSSNNNPVSAEIVQPQRTLAIIPRGPAAKVAAPLPKRGLTLGGGGANNKPLVPTSNNVNNTTNATTTSSSSSPSGNNNTNNAGWSWDADEDEWN